MKEIKTLPYSPLPPAPNEGTATPFGASYFGAFNECPRLWLLKYGLGIRAPDVDGSFDARNLGTLYHAFLMDNWSDSTKALKEQHPLLAQQAEGYAIERKRLAENGTAPLPEMASRHRMIEELITFMIDGRGPFTTQPDVLLIEDGSITRALDFKTAARFGPTDVQSWEVSPSMLMELLGIMKTDKWPAPNLSAVVDILVKTKELRVERVEISLSDEKRALLTADLVSTFDRLQKSWNQWSNSQVSQGEFVDGDAHAAGYPASLSIFPPCLKSCSGKFGRPCDFYNFCHGREAMRSTFLKRGTPEATTPVVKGSAQ